MKQNFDTALKLVLKYEGGWASNPHDPGGDTLNGVTQTTYNIYRRHKGLPVRSVREMETSERGEIYKSGYWDEVNADALEPGVDALAFDIAVNSGPGRVRPWLEMSKGMKPVDRVKFLHGRRLAFWQRLGTWVYFGKGWSARENDLLQHALSMAERA